MVIDVDYLLFDDRNEAKFGANNVSLFEVQDVFDRYPRFYVNRPGRRASHVMLGPTRDGRMLVVPIQDDGDGVWRPVTAFEPTPRQTARYRRF
jgi:hypothetical protein